MAELDQEEQAPVLDEKTAAEYILKANRNVIHDICKEYELSEEDYRNVKDALMVEINNGLCKYTHNKATVKCLLTHVQSVPTGCEKGKYLALDLGGTKFRVIYLQMDDLAVKECFMTYQIRPELLIGPARDLFDFFAECLSNFIYSHQLENVEIPLGFTFSFPVKQVSIDKGVLVAWSKGFSCPGVVGRDVVALLNEAIERRGDMLVRVVAIVNDTTGTLMSTAWKYHNTKIGLIVGTGTNACYMEKTKNISMYDGDILAPAVMIINTEWSGLGDNGVLEGIRTKHDRVVDSESTNPKAHLFEKMISGMYLGEVARLLIIECIESGALLNGVISDAISQPKSFPTSFVSEIDRANEDCDILVAKTVLNSLGYSAPSDADCENLQHICSTVIIRSASLVGAALACLIDRIGDPYVTIGADGSLYRLNKSYHRRILATARKLTRPEHKYDLIPSEDGSGRGAALIAAIVSKNA